MLLKDPSAFVLQSFELDLDPALPVAEHQTRVREALSNRRVAIFDVLLKDRLAAGNVRMLEVGVFMAANIKYAMPRHPGIVEYTGVDDYGRSGNSPYVAASSYWPTAKEADAQYEESKAAFESFGQTLHRMTSDEFKRSVAAERMWDVVFVDGNHKLAFALADMRNYFEHVAPGGIMLVDDYDNPDTPEVTRAVMQFLSENRTRIAKITGVRCSFLNGEKLVPTSLVILALHKVS